MAVQATDSHELAEFGYKQELDRSLGSFSSFAAGFSYISILTGVFQLFAFGFAFGGPAVWWTWPIVFIGQMSVALCFAELAGQYPLAGSVYQWSKRIGSDFTSWMAGWIMVVGSIVTVAAVAVAWQVILPQVSTSFQILGDKADAGTYLTKGGAQNAILLGAILVVFTTIVNMIGVKLMARINNAGVILELIGATLLIVLLIFHFSRGPGVVFDTLGLGEGYKLGYFGAFIIGGIMSAYVMYGFDTAGTLAEETNDPRRNAPPAIIKALATASVIGGLLILFALMAVNDIHDKNIPLLGLPYIVKQALGDTIGNVFLIDSAIAIAVCCLAVHTSCIRMMFAMARDDRLPVRPAGGARVGPREGADRAGPRRRHPRDRPAGHQHHQPERVPGPHVGGDHHVLPRLPVRDRPAAPAPHARDVADPRARHVLLARALGDAGQRLRGHLRRDRGLQHRVAAQGGLQRDRRVALVLPVGRVPVHRRRVPDRRDLLLHRLQPQADRGHRRAQRDDRGSAAAAHRRSGAMTPEDEFDYVIAGGGTAGCVVAARLSEDPNVRVCLIEAGPSDVDDDAILRLEDWMYLLDSGYDWDYLVEPQEKGNSFLRHARAKVLGGCSSHNSCIAFWTPREDLDEWAAMGNTGWSAEECWPLITRLETNDAPGDHHGRSGPVNIRTVPPEDPCGVAILEAAAQAGLPTSAFNAGHTVTNGAGWFQINSGADNTRMSSSHAYLHPIIDSRPNLEIRTHCWVSKVLFDDQRRAIGVDYLSPDLLTHTTVIARREVVLSAGAIDTPEAAHALGHRPGRAPAGVRASTSSSTPPAWARTSTTTSRASCSGTRASR